MSVAPLLNAAPAIPLHAFAAMTAFLLGVVQLAAPKGTLPHRTLGWIWVSLMVSVAVSSFWIHQIRLIGPWSPIHLLSIFTLVTLPLGVWSLEPDPFAVDLHAGDAPTRRMDGAPSPGRGSSPHHDPDFLRCACRRRAVHSGPGADHAHRLVRPLAPRRELSRPTLFRHRKPGLRTGSKGRFTGPGGEWRGTRKSLEKRGEKPVAPAS